MLASQAESKCKCFPQGFYQVFFPFEDRAVLINQHEGGNCLPKPETECYIEERIFNIFITFNQIFCRMLGIASNDHFFWSIYWYVQFFF